MTRLRHLMSVFLVSLNVFSGDYFLEHNNIDLHALIAQNNIHKLEYYVQQNLDRVNEKTDDHHGNTLLHVAVSYNNVAAAHILLRFGANPCIFNNAYQKPSELVPYHSWPMYSLLRNAENCFYGFIAAVAELDATCLPWITTLASMGDNNQEMMALQGDDHPTKSEIIKKDSIIQSKVFEQKSLDSASQDKEYEKPSLEYYGVQKNSSNHWSTKEHEKLLELVEKHGTKNWHVIAAEFGGSRTNIQCRERFRNFSPAINKNKFSHDEKKLLIYLHAKHGNQWARIAKIVNGNKTSGLRNSTDIKNFICDQKRKTS